MSGEAHGSDALSDVLALRRVIRLQSGKKRAALKELVDVLCRDAGAPVQPKEMLDALWKREQSLSTEVSPRIAIAHARIERLTRTLAAIGKSADGIPWCGEEPVPVHLVILVVGNGHDHLRVLSRIAARLSSPTLRESILGADSPSVIFNLFTMPYGPVEPSRAPDAQRCSDVCLRHAFDMAGELRAAAVVLHADASAGLSFLDELELPDIRLIVVTRDASRFAPVPAVHRFLTVPFAGVNRSQQIDIALLFLVSQGLLKRHEQIVSVCGPPESGFLDTILISNLRHDNHRFLPEAEEGEILPKDVEPHVLARVLQVAAGLADEGREGKPVGTLFVLGDTERVRRYCRQMVINPFQGYAEEDRHILDPGMEETVKEFSRIDGAFVLRGNGVIESAGTYLRADADIERLTPGLGARHAAAAAISLQTQALSVALSESTRRVSLFRNGERILEF